MLKLFNYYLATFQKEEFSRCVDISPYTLFRDSEVFVLWKWTWD